MSSISSATPLYLTLRARIAADLDGMQPGERLPSEAEYCRRFGVSRMTVSRALAELVRENRVLRIAGMGSFAVQAAPAETSLFRVGDIKAEIAERGARHEARVVVQRRVEVGADTARLFDLAPGSTLCHLVLVHLENDLPVLLDDRLINPLVAEDFLDVDFAATSPHAYLQTAAPLTEFEHTIEACAPDLLLRRHLGVAADEPCLRIVRRTWSGPVICTVARLYYASSRYRLVSRIKL